MAEPAVAAYGTWPSPIAASYSVEGSVGLGFPASASFGIVWEESRPDERGRVALVASGLSGTTELLPPEMSARTMAHEYGGRAWAVGGPGDERLVASNWEDQRLWDLTPGGAPRPLTPEAAEGTSLRYANPVISPDGAWVVAVREAHEPQGVVNDLVAVSLRQGGEPRILARGHDFYSFPALSADGRRLAFVSWDHPNMPWDSTQLWEAPFEDGALGELRPVAGQGTDESVVQPKWSVDGELFYISDRSGWWNLYQGSRSLAPLEQEFAGPAWTFGDSDYVLLGDGRVVATWGKGAEGHFGSLVGGSAVPQELPPYRSFKHVAPGPVGHDGQSVLAVAAGPRHSPAVVRINLEGGAEVLRQSEAREWPAEWVSVAEPFEFPTDGGVTGHGLYYAPRNPGFRPLPGEMPPLVVSAHGGPTGAANPSFNVATQYWTSRGFAVAEVDYRGSSGYGRAYRRSLEGLWGVADVDDCAAAASWLAREGLADANRTVMRGRSASGLTALAVLARHRNFAAGAVRFPVTELDALVATTHKFESHYLDRLVPLSEYGTRSPARMASHVRAPVLFLHGLDDKVAAPEQSRLMVSALRDGGSPALLIEIEGEGHGFRRADVIVRAQQAELAFLAGAVGAQPAGDLDQARADLEAAMRPGGARWEIPGRGPAL